MQSSWTSARRLLCEHRHLTGISTFSGAVTSWTFLEQVITSTVFCVYNLFSSLCCQSGFFLSYYPEKILFLLDSNRSPQWIAPRETAEVRSFALCPNSKRKRFRSRRQVHSLVGDPHEKRKYSMMKKRTWHHWGDENDLRLEWWSPCQVTNVLHAAESYTLRW